MCRLAYIVITVFTLAIGSTVFGQQGNVTPVVVERRRSEEKPRVVAIQRVNLIVDDRGPDGASVKNRVPHVEIRLHVGFPDFSTQLGYLMQIGDREFYVHHWKLRDGIYDAVLLMPTADFNELEDGSEICFRAGDPITREVLKKLREQGKRSCTDKIGELDKKMIDLTPTIERSASWEPQPRND